MEYEENWQKKNYASLTYLLTDMISTFRAFATSVRELKRRKYGMNETSVQCYFRSLIESLDFRWIFVYPCRKLQNWSHTILSTNYIKVFDVDGSSNFIPACRGVFFCNLPWFFFVFAGRAEAAVSWSSVVQSSTMCRNGCMGNTVYNFAIITNFTYL